MNDKCSQDKKNQSIWREEKKANIIRLLANITNFDGRKGKTKSYKIEANREETKCET